MKLLSVETLRPHVNGRPVVNGFVTYTSATRPELMLCTGFEDYSDGYDDFTTCTSQDNGCAWSAPVPWLASRKVARGRLRYAEPAAYYDQRADRLVVLVDENLYPDDKLDVDGVCRVVQRIYDPQTRTWTEPVGVDLTPGRSLAVSFGFPLQRRSGEILVPVMRPMLDAQGQPVHYADCWATADEPLTLIGRWTADGGLHWALGAPPPVDVGCTSRGINENTLAELADGRLAMVGRGDNSMFPERPGYKWLSFSEDGGRTWSAPVPLPCDRGEPLESSSTGSALFRHVHTGKLYWMGNLCPQGVRARGNYPRVPLVVAEVQEEPFALKRDTLFVIGDRREGEPPEVQMSNFRFYQDRATGDLVVFVTRYAERGAKDWMLADYYRYRVAMP